MKKLLLILMIGLSGCASLHSRVQNDIHIGDSREQVKSVLGDPVAFRPSSDMKAEHWVFQGDGSLCAMTFLDDKLLAKECQPDSSYVSTGKSVTRGLGMALQGMGNGLQQTRSVSCTSTNYGYQTVTNCQ